MTPTPRASEANYMNTCHRCGQLMSLTSTAHICANPLPFEHRSYFDPLRPESADELRHNMRERIAQLESTVSALVEALRKYGQHDEMCDVIVWGSGNIPYECTCGLDQALARANEKEGK